MNKIILASQDKGKVRVVEHILKDLNDHITSLSDINESMDIEEIGSIEGEKLIWFRLI